jgi:hypothetical protein
MFDVLGFVGNRLEMKLWCQTMVLLQQISVLFDFEISHSIFFNEKRGLKPLIVFGQDMTRCSVHC